MLHFRVLDAFLEDLGVVAKPAETGEGQESDATAQPKEGEPQSHKLESLQEMSSLVTMAKKAGFIVDAIISEKSASVLELWRNVFCSGLFCFRAW